MLVCILLVSILVCLCSVDALVVNVAAKLADVVNSHIVCYATVEPAISRLDVLVVLVVTHLHLSIQLVLQHTPLILVALVLQHLVECSSVLIHVSQHVEHLAHHPTTE